MALPGQPALLNEYTITLDVKLDRLPTESLSLFQANQARPTEGECFISSHGGVGIFGEYGVKGAEVHPEAWHRVVVTLGPDRPGGIPKMCTYVNGAPCAVVSKGVFETPNARFALSSQTVRLFASCNSKLMPGVLVRYVDIRVGAMPKQKVLETVNANRVFSYWEVQREKGSRALTHCVLSRPRLTLLRS